MNISTEDDLNVLDSLQAADPGNPSQPVDASPLQHVPEEELRNLSELRIDMPAVQEEAEQAQAIATEAMRLKKVRRIHALEAAELAVMVPAIQGTPETPVSYTSVPTSVGVDHAVAVMETAAADGMGAAVSKASDVVDRLVGQIPQFLNKQEQGWLAAQASYLQARAGCQAATGGLPESNYDMFLGQVPAPEALNVIVNDVDEEKYGPTLTAYGKALAKITGVSFLGLDLYRRPLALRMGMHIFLVKAIVGGSAQPIDSHDQPRGISYGHSLTAPATVYPETIESLNQVVTVIAAKLSALKVELDGAEPDEPTHSIQARTEQIKQITLYAGLLGAAQGYLTKCIALTEAATQFYQDCATGAQVKSLESIALQRSAVPRRFFD